MYFFYDNSSNALNRLKKKRGEWVVSMGVGYDLDVVDLSYVEGNSEVICLSQVLRKLSDHAVGSRDCVLVSPAKDGAKLWTGICLSDFIRSVGDELNQKAVKMLGDEVVSVVVYEAYKLLKEDFTIIMESTLRIKENAKFVKSIR